MAKKEAKRCKCSKKEAKTETLAYRLKCAKSANGLSHFVMYGDVAKKDNVL